MKPSNFKDEVWEISQEPFDNQEIIDLREKAHKDPEVIANWKKINQMIKSHTDSNNE